MRYVSTRGGAPPCRFEDALLTGLAPDGGLYVPEDWPAPLPLNELAVLPWPELAARVIQPFVGDAVAPEALRSLVRAAAGTFRHAAVAPLVQVDERLWLLELFHGPTLAFKDVALQILGRLFDHVLARQGRRVTIIGATSGDTGSAAIEAFRGRAACDVFILYPEGRVSPVQRRQMTTVASANVQALAIEGSFDDCQDLVKALFADAQLQARLGLAAVNSINWARIIAQTAYYVSAGLALGAPGRRVNFTVPTGNFGNVYAGWVAARLGLPVGRFLVASNANDILYRHLTGGAMAIETVTPTLSPSMDIQVSSNYERLLFELVGRDGGAVAQLMAEFRRTGRMEPPPAPAGFEGARADDAETLAAIARLHAQTGLLIDPHTAVGLHAARARPGPAPEIVLACAHPAKFPEAVARATGVQPPLPDHLADLFQRPERLTTLPNDARAVARHLLDHACAATGAAA